MQERLQKIIARAGIASRRHAEQLILSGQVRVNGRVVRELGTKADAARDGTGATGKRDWHEDENSAAAGRDTETRGELLVRSADAGYEERRDEERFVSRAASGRETEARGARAANAGGSARREVSAFAGARGGRAAEKDEAK